MLELSALFALLIMSAFFSSSETAFLSMSRPRLDYLAEDGSERDRASARRIQRLLTRPKRLLNAILLGNNLVNTAIAAAAGALATSVFKLSDGMGVLVATAVVTIVLVLFGEVLPKGFALMRPFTLARFMAPILGVWTWLAAPVSYLLELLSNFLFRFGRNVDNGEGGVDSVLSTDEIRAAILTGVDAGEIESEQAQPLLGALTLHDLQAREIMVSRLDMVTIQSSATIRDASRLLSENGFLRLPAYGNDTDSITHVIHVSDINAAIQMTESAFDLRVKDIARPAIFESETATVERVVQVMRENHTHMIVLSDESGALAGLVTLEDIVEEIFGSLLSESGTDRDGTKDLNGDMLSLPAEVDGRVLLVDLSRQLDVDLTGVAASTVGGLILEHSRRFLERGEWMEYANLRFTVMERDDRRLTKIAIDHSERNRINVK